MTLHEFYMRPTRPNPTLGRVSDLIDRFVAVRVAHHLTFASCILDILNQFLLLLFKLGTFSIEFALSFL